MNNLVSSKSSFVYFHFELLQLHLPTISQVLAMQNVAWLLPLSMLRSPITLYMVEFIASFKGGLVRRLIKFCVVYFLGLFHPLRYIPQILIHMPTHLLIFDVFNITLKNLRCLERQMIAMASRALTSHTNTSRNLF